MNYTDIWLFSSVFSLLPLFLVTHLPHTLLISSICSIALTPFHPPLTVHPLPPPLQQQHHPSSHPTQMKDQGGPVVHQQALSPAQLPEEAECLTVPKYKRDLVQKLKILRQELSQQQPQAGHCRIEVCREEIFEVLKKKHLKTTPEQRMTLSHTDTHKHRNAKTTFLYVCRLWTIITVKLYLSEMLHIRSATCSSIKIALILINITP